MVGLRDFFRPYVKYQISDYDISPLTAVNILNHCWFVCIPVVKDHIIKMPTEDISVFHKNVLLLHFKSYSLLVFPGPLGLQYINKSCSSFLHHKSWVLNIFFIFIFYFQISLSVAVNLFQSTTHSDAANFMSVLL